MTKTPAPNAPARKPAASKPAAPVKAAAPSAKAAAPSAKAAAGKTASKSAPAAPAKPTPAKPVAAKPAIANPEIAKPVTAKPVAAKPEIAKPVAAKTAPAKPIKPTAAARPQTAPAAHAVTPKVATAHPSPPMKPAPTPPITATPPPAPVPPPKKLSRSAAKYAAPAVQAPLPPPTSRFADRFAPPRPPTRQMNNLELDTPRHAHKSDPKLVNAWETKTGRELTEPEILAMPDAEYMNDKQLDFFRLRLQTLKDDLLSNAGETTEHLREDTSIVPDPADRATIEEEHALELRTRDRERKLLKKISQSLSRLDSGEYGFCDETGEPIGLGRLIARPTATLSLEAQQRRELKQKMFGD